MNPAAKRHLIVLITCLPVLAPPSRADTETSTQFAPGSAAKPRIAVRDFRIIGDVHRRDEWLGVGVAEMLSWRLQRAPELVVIPRVHLFRARQELTAGDDSNVWDKLLLRVGATWELSGTCQGTPMALELTLNLTPVGDTTGEPHTLTVPARAFLAALDAATSELLGAFEIQPDRDGTHRAVFAPLSSSRSAVEYYVQALMAARQRDLQDAYYRVNRALAYDETFRPALAMIVQLEMEAGAAAHQRVHRRVLAWRQLAARVDDRVGASAAERGLGAIQQVTGAGHAAYRHFETALALAYAAGDPYEQMAALDALANLFATWPPPNEASEAAATAARRKRLDWARDWQTLSLKLAQAVEDDFAILAAADQLARLAEQRGDVAGLLANRLAALEASQRLAVPGLEATAWLRLSQAYASDQQWDNAVTTAEQCIALGVSPMRSAGHILLAEIFLETDQAETALTELEAAWSLLQDQDNAAAQIACLIRLGEVNRALGRQKAAVAKLEEAIRRAEKLGLPQAEGLRRQLAEWRQSAE